MGSDERRKKTQNPSLGKELLKAPTLSMLSLMDLSLLSAVEVLWVSVQQGHIFLQKKNQCPKYENYTTCWHTTSSHPSMAKSFSEKENTLKYKIPQPYFW